MRPFAVTDAVNVQPRASVRCFINSSAAPCSACMKARA